MLGEMVGCFSGEPEWVYLLTKVEKKSKLVLPHSDGVSNIPENFDPDP